jgi:hypothetical protein
MCVFTFTLTLCLDLKNVPKLVFIRRQFFIHAKSMCQLRSFDSACFCPPSFSCQLSSQSLQHVYIFVCSYRGIPLTVQNADRHPLLYPFSSFPLRWNKTYYNIDHTHPYVALYCTRNCESCFALSLFLTPERCPESALCW